MGREQTDAAEVLRDFSDFFAPQTLQQLTIAFLIMSIQICQMYTIDTFEKYYLLWDVNLNFCDKRPGLLYLSDFTCV